MKSICFILGTRPEIIKLSPLIRGCIKRKTPYFIIHTNQHYSANLDRIFFKELKLPPAKYNLNIGSAKHGQQTGNMIIKIERILWRKKPSHIIVQGDTNSVLAGAMAAAKELNIQVAHVEAGLRSYDRTMPEEINRVVADHISDLLFAPTDLQKQILIQEGIPKERIFVVGNTIVDAVLNNYQLSIHKAKILEKLTITGKKYLLLTLHRPSNVDDKKTLFDLFKGIQMASEKIHINRVIFPVHPRTKKNIKQFKIKIPQNIILIPPVGYLEMLRLIKNTKIVLTDSGGIQEEACILNVPCVTLRDNTERPETLKVGGNILAGSNPKKIISSVLTMHKKEINWTNPFGDGRAAKKIIDVIMS